MATLKLDKKAGAKTAAKADSPTRRAPLRGKGVSRPRQTLEQAQAEREALKQQRESQQARSDERARATPPARQGTGTPTARPQTRPALPRVEPETRPLQPPLARPLRSAPTPRTNPSEGERLSKRMSDLGIASRREADEWIASGWVRVDGRVAEIGERVGHDVRIDVDPAARHEQAQRVTILINKPIGYVSGQAEDGYEPAVALVKANTRWKDDPSDLRFAAGHLRGLAPAGRLDIDSTGLLVLTQDGRVAKALIGEDSRVEKEYLVRVEFIGQSGHPQTHLPPESLALLQHGLELDGVRLKPAKVSWQNEDQLRFVLREGRKRQVRRMCELVGLKVVGLKRVRIGRINLGHLPMGQWRYLAPWERFD